MLYEVITKKLGSRIFVDVARILALAAGSTAVNSFDRLREAGPASSMQPREIAAAGKALSALLGLRLEQQMSAAGSHGEADFVITSYSIHYTKLYDS